MEKKFKTEQENAIISSYKASYCIILAVKAHIFAELLIKPVITDVASSVLDAESIEKLK